MSGDFLNSTQETVRYKNRKNAVEEEKDAVILISSPFEENRGSEENKRSFSQLKICFYPASIFITLLVILVTVGILYYSTNISQGSLNGSCVPLQRVRKVVIVTERTDFTSCSDNKTCHLFLDVIKQKHDGLNYNFVIGQRGELFIGAGFNCLINSDKNALNVKLLESEMEPFDQYLKKCFRLFELINHGILCDKISPDYAIQGEKEICSSLGSGKNKSYHVHDPGHEVKLIHGDFGWTVCGSFSTTINVKKDKVITLESLSKDVCSPLQLVDKVTVDIEESPRFMCSDRSSCLREYEEHHEGFKYNFIINHNQDVYVGLGFKCKADSTSSNTLRIKVLREPESSDTILGNFLQLEKYLLILEEGFACGKISERFSVNVNCDIIYKLYPIGDCKKDYETFKDIELIKLELEKYFKDFNTVHLTISSEDGRYIVPKSSRYHFCHRESSKDTTTLMSEPTANIGTTSDQAIITSESSCIPFKQVDRVIVYTEETDYLCSKNVTCPSLLDTIERKHNGSKYNFVIGPGGELYIGAGFRCLVNRERDLFVKFLIKDVSPKEEQFEICSRLSELIQHGIECGKISQHYYAFPSRKANDWIPFGKCLKRDEFHKNRSHHLHDPDYGTRTRLLVPENFKWTFCGNFSNRTNMEKDRIITLENLPENFCSPLQLVDEINVDVVETSPIECSDNLSCLGAFEKQCDGLNYNFIIGQLHDVYVGSGFNCKAERTSDNILKIKVLRKPFILNITEVWQENEKMLQIIEEGKACGKISEVFSVKVNCYTTHIQKSSCKENYENFNDEDWIKLNTEVMVTHSFAKYYNISYGHGIVPRFYKYQFCNREHPSDTSSSISDSMTEQPSTTPSELYDYRVEVEDEDTYSDYRD